MTLIVLIFGGVAIRRFWRGAKRPIDVVSLVLATIIWIGSLVILWLRQIEPSIRLTVPTATVIFLIIAASILTTEGSKKRHGESAHN